MKKTIPIELDLEILKIVEKRSKENFMTVQELMEDIIRRSMISYKKGNRPIKVDDNLVGIFSREKRGRKKVKKKKNGKN